MCSFKTIPGFTLIEMLVTVAIAAVAMTIVYPSYSRFIIDAKEKSATNALMGAVRKARTEALSRNTPVSICRSQNLTDCNPGGGTWADGWLIFTDSAGIGTIDGTDTVLHRHEALDSEVVITADNTIAEFIRFSSSGRPVATGSVSLAADTTNHTLTVTRSGRIAYLAPEE
jgi:type IV fimbrial biogenesis protein FimT